MLDHYPQDPPGSMTLSELIGQAATLSEEELVGEIGAAFLLLHRVDLRARSSGETEAANWGQTTADLGFLAVPLRSRESQVSDVVVGRSEDTDIVLLHSTVSKRHARLHLDDDGVFVVTDLGSRNGTFVDGIPVGLEEAGRSRPVKSRQTVRFGSVSLTFVEPADLLDFSRLLVR